MIDIPPTHTHYVFDSSSCFFNAGDLKISFLEKNE